MLIDITAEISAVDFAPQTVLAEIMQNVRTIITTKKGSVPMDRAFGINAEALDLPIGIAKAKLSAEIVAAVHKYEPRARVTRVIYEDKEQDGFLRAKVRVAINDGT